jgi:histone-lysine N-methyltransferase SETMAR
MEFLPQGSALNIGVYCDTLKKLCHSIQNKRRAVLSWSVVMLLGSVRPHTAAAMQDLTATVGWEQFDHPPYGPDLAPSDFHVFLHLKTFLGGLWFHNDSEVKVAVNT